ncbi:MAG: hypothetical protein M1836_006860 [Candelina mexicana]|nr:MAG: hypothetical protein M1836_006860 [Candelina mexicana]
MATSQRSRRTRSGGLAYDEEDALPPVKENGVKRSKADNGAAARQVNGRSAAKKKPTRTGEFAMEAKARCVETLNSWLMCLVAYDEEVEGFMFTRTRSKTKKAEAVAVTEEPVVEKRPVKENKATPKERKRKKSVEPEAPVEKKRKRSPSAAKSEATEGSMTRRSARTSAGEEGHAQRSSRRGQDKTADEKKEGDEGDSMEHPGEAERVEVSRDTTKIALPFADTPIIRRNKELRKGGGQGHRRSSIGMRGRRASSLIDSGTSNAVPHKEVEISEFHKHISGQGLSEPRRMKQLLTWCGARALGDKPSYSDGDVSARQAARVIQEELLKEFSNVSEMSDWFSREEPPPTTVVKKPNPRNVENAAKIQSLEAQIKRLQDERSAWEALLAPPPPPSPQPSPTLPSPSQIDQTYLDPEQASILTTVTSLPPIASTTSTRLHTITSNLEFTIDQFADGVHGIGQFRHTADRVAGRVLELCAETLRNREEESRRRAGTLELPVQEVLRSISRLER